MKSLIALFSISLLLSAVLVPVTRWLFLKFGKLDLPDARKMHSVAVPRSGGLAIIGAYLLSVAILALLPASGNQVLERYTSFLIHLMPATAIIFATGFLDDWHNLKPKYKILGQLLASGMAYWAGVRLFDVAPSWDWLGFAATAFWLILCSNAFNLIDGTDGLAGTLTVVSSVGLIIVALSLDYYPLALVFAPLLGATLPFLRVNWPPANLFLGDTGSLTLGFLIGCGGATLARRFPEGGGLTAAILILTLPLMEVALSTARRLLRGQPIFEADSFHIHHQLKRQGLDSSRVLWRLGAVTLLGTAIAIAQIRTGPWERAFLVVPFLLLLGHDITRLRYPEFAVLGEALLGGRFRTWLRQQIRLRSMENELMATEEFERSCQILEKYARQIGVLELNVFLNGMRFESQVFEADLPSAFTIRIDLPLHSWVNFRVPTGDPSTEAPSAAYASALMRIFTALRLARLQREKAVFPDFSVEVLALDRSG